MGLRTQHIGATLIVLVMCLRFVPDAAADTPLIERIRRAWQKREDAVRTYVVEWDEQRTIPKGKAGIDNQGNRLPVEDSVYTIRHRMAGSGNRLRLDRSGPQYDMTTKQVIEKQFVRVFDGQERRELFFGEYKKDHPDGFINKGKFFDDGTYLGIQPVALSFRPLRTELGGIDLATFHVSEFRGSVNGIACSVLERPHGPKGIGVDRLWVEQKEDFRILRRQLGMADRPHEELTISYDEDSNGRVKQWTYLARNSSEVPDQISASQTTQVQVNISVADEVFNYHFPKGSVVTYEGSNEIAIARDNETLRPVTAGELGAGISLETLMNTDPLPEARAPGRRWSITFMASCVAAGIIAASYTVYYCYRHKTTT